MTRWANLYNQILPRPLDEYRRQDTCWEQEGDDGYVDEHGRAVQCDSARVRLEEGVTGDKGRDGEETGGHPDPQEDDGRVESGD